MKAPYPRRMGSDWWLQRGAYTLVMARELTSVFIAAYLVAFLILLAKLGEGPGAYSAYIAFLASPGMVLLHTLALAASLLHTVTWFNLAPKALVVRMGEEKLPPAAIAGTHYVAWLAFSAGVLWLVLG